MPKDGCFCQYPGFDDVSTVLSSLANSNVSEIPALVGVNCNLPHPPCPDPLDLVGHPGQGVEGEV